MKNVKREKKYGDLSQSWEPLSSDESPREDDLDGSVTSEHEGNLHTSTNVAPQGPVRRRISSRHIRTSSSTARASSQPQTVKEPLELVMPSMTSSSVHMPVARTPPRPPPRARLYNVRSKSTADSDHTGVVKRKGRTNQTWAYTRPVLGYLGQVLGGSLFWLQPLFSFILAVALLWYGYRYAIGTAGSALQSMQRVLVVPLCSLPGLSVLPMCRQDTAEPGGGHPEFEKLMTAQTNFDEVLESSAVYASLPMDLKRTEMSIRDLKHIVLYSTLPSRQELSLEFETFVETARQAGFDLTKFNSAIGRTMDQMLSTNRWTLQVIEGVSQRESEQGAVARFFYRSVPSALGFHARGIDEVILDQYLKHTSLVEDQISKLVLEAQALLALLGHLDNQLDIIAGVVTRDGITVSQDRDKLFAYLWTKLGGNRSSVKKLDEQIQLLNNVNGYRKAAWAHVNRALLKLQEIQADLVNLKERVALPETVGLDIPLLQHIDIIRLGVERLENARRQQRSVEDAKIRQFIGVQQSGDGVKVIQGTAIAGRRG